MDKQYKIYAFTNIENGKKYVGMTCQTLSERSGSNGVRYKRCRTFYNAIKKYGWNNFDGEILLDNLTKDEAEIKEKEMIKILKTQDPNFDYSVAEGGSNPPQTPYGESNPFYGNSHTKRTRQIISESNKRRIWTEESRKKLSESMKGSKSPCAKKIICIETKKIYSSLTEAARDIGAAVTSICNVLRGDKKSIKGFHFQYYNIVS